MKRKLNLLFFEDKCYVPNFKLEILMCLFFNLVFFILERLQNDFPHQNVTIENNYVFSNVDDRILRHFNTTLSRFKTAFILKNLHSEKNLVAIQVSSFIFLDKCAQ